MRCAMPTKIVNLPCKASELAETIRCFCEHNGSFDTAIVTLESKQDINSFTPVIRLIITIPKEKKS